MTLPARHPFTHKALQEAVRVRPHQSVFAQAVRSIVDQLNVGQCVLIRLDTKTEMKRTRAILQRHKQRWARDCGHVSPIHTLTDPDGMYIMKVERNLL